jgi:hypothetical protein
MLLLANRPLIGPPAAEVFDRVSHGDFIAAIVSGIDGLLRDLEPDTCNVLLTLARIWCTAATGAVRSKDAAAVGRCPASGGRARGAFPHARGVFPTRARRFPTRARSPWVTPGTSGKPLRPLRGEQQCSTLLATPRPRLEPRQRWSTHA